MKKRILSLILALSMVLSVLPLGAFAADPNQDLVMENGLPDCSNGTSGNGWSYDNNTKTLTLTSGTYDFSFTHPQNKTGTQPAPAVQCFISNGMPDPSQQNVSIIGGTFEKKVTNWGTITGNSTFNGEVINRGTITGNSIFNGTVYNGDGKISGGTFQSTGSVTNWGTITGGTFAGSVENKHDIYGGVFNRNATLTDVTGGHNITWDEAYPGAKIEKVNGVPANWAPYVVVTASTMNQEVTITASTDIYSLNGKSLSTNPYSSSQDNSDKTTVKFTMPKEGVTIGCGGLVMENGYPVGSNGNGWSYDNNTQTLTLTDGTYDFSYTYPQNSNGAGAEPVACAVETQLRVKITGGTFEGEVINNDLGVISGGTFHEKVSNYNGMITGGTFKSSVTSKGHGRIFGGVFNGNANLTGVTGGCSITVASNAKIEKVNGVSADWAPYVVTSNATTKEVTITADTEIFSLNGQPIAESSYGVDKKTVTFTMPDDDVVLNGELITKPEPEPTTYTVTVIGGTIDGKTSVSAKENDTLTVVLDQNDIPDGMTFDMWSISSSKLSGDINVDYRAEAMTFQMPAEDVTIRAQYRSAEIIEDAAPSPLATAATIAVGGAAAGIVVWQGVNLGVDLYLANALPQGVPVPTDRRALALLLWETAGKPEVALPTLYGDIPAEEIELQKATHWAVQNGLMDAADKKDASFFDPDHYVTKMDVFGAWLRLKKLLGTIGTSPTQ